MRTAAPPCAIESRPLADWVGIELRHFAALEAVAATGSFTDAARRLGYVQSAISHQIATLERIVGARLVDRSRRGGAALTREGRLVLEHGAAIQARIKAAQDDILALRHGAIGIVRVCYEPFLPAVVASRAVALLVRRPTAAMLEAVLETSHEALVENLNSGLADIAISSVPEATSQFQSVRLCEERYRIVVSATSRWCRRAFSSARDLEGVPIVVPRMAAYLEQALQAAVRDVNVRYRVDSAGALQAIVGANAGVGLLPASACPIDANLDCRGPCDWLPSSVAYAVWRSADTSRTVSDVLSCLRSAASEMSTLIGVAASS